MSYRYSSTLNSSSQDDLCRFDGRVRRRIECRTKTETRKTTNDDDDDEDERYVEVGLFLASDLIPFSACLWFYCFIHK
jgi:hypothetical protein